MNREVSLVELRMILHSCLVKSEKILNQTLQKRHNRSIFVLSAFEQLRILLGRLLVILRWKKRTKIHCMNSKQIPQMALTISKDDYPKFPLLPPIKKINSTFYHIFCEFPIFSAPLRNQILFIPNTFVFQIPHYVKILNFKIGQNHFFLKTNEFTIVGNKFKDGYIVTNIDFLWPTKISIVGNMQSSIQSYLKCILDGNIKFSLREPEKLNKLILSLHKFYLIGQFAFISQELYKYRDDFSYEIIYVSDFELDIFFSEGYQPYNRFRLSLTENRIIFKSASTLYMDEPENVYLKLEKRKSMYEHFQPMKLRKFYEFSFTEFCPSNIQSILTEVRDYLVYTRMMIVFCLLQRSMVCLPFLNFVAEFTCKGSSLSCSSILLYFFNRPCILLTVDHRSGQIIFQNLGRLIYDLSIFQNDFGNEITTVTQFLKCFVITEVLIFHFNLMGRHFATLMTHSRVPFFIRDSHRWFFSLSFSFAPDFQVFFIIRPGTPDYYVMTNDFQLIKSTKLIEYMNINSIHRSISEAVSLNKVLLILLQLEKSLNENGCKIRRYEDRLTIFMDLLPKVQLKIKANGYWSLIFHRQSYPFNESGILTITGANITCRIAHRIIGIINNISELKTLMRKAETICGLTQFYKENDLSVYLGVQGYHIKLSMAPFRDHFTIGESGYFVSSSRSPLRIATDFSCRTFPFPINFSVFKKETFGVFLNTSLPSLIKYKSILDNKNWTISYLSGSDSFYLIYKKAVTLNIQMKPLQYFAVVIPNFGCSKFLQIPLSVFPLFFRLIKLTHHTYKIHITELESLKDRVAFFYDDFAMLSQLGFNVLPMQNETNISSSIMEANFSFRVRATIDVNGLSFACSDCPVLTKLLNKLQEKFGQINRNFFRSAFLHVCNVAKCEHHVANMSFFIIRQCLKQSWIKDINWTVFFNDMVVDIKNKKFDCSIQTQKSTIYIEVTKKGSRPIMIVSLPSNKSMTFNDTESFRHWFKQESASQQNNDSFVL